MSPGAASPFDPVAIDVGRVVRRTVASLYSHLVTRPTGRAVRQAIERQLEEAGERTLCLVDLSEVRILDFSCADEVVAKLLLRSVEQRGKAGGAYFVFRGIQETHRDPIEAVLDRQRLAAVGETGSGCFELLGTSSDEELRVWSLVEEHRSVSRDGGGRLLPEPRDRKVLKRLARRSVVLDLPERSEYRALSTLVPG